MVSSSGGGGGEPLRLAGWLAGWLLLSSVRRMSSEPAATSVGPPLGCRAPPRPPSTSPRPRPQPPPWPPPLLVTSAHRYRRPPQPAGPVRNRSARSPLRRCCRCRSAWPSTASPQGGDERAPPSSVRPPIRSNHRRSSPSPAPARVPRKNPRGTFVFGVHRRVQPGGHWQWCCVESIRR